MTRILDCKVVDWTMLSKARLHSVPGRNWYRLAVQQRSTVALASAIDAEAVNYATSWKEGAVHRMSFEKNAERLAALIGATDLQFAAEFPVTEGRACRRYNQAGCFEDDTGRPMDPKSCWACGMPEEAHKQ